MTTDWSAAIFFASFISLAISIAALVVSIIMHLRVSRIFRSASASNIERLMKLHTKTLEDLLKFQAEATGRIRSLDGKLMKKTGTISTTRFNPFHGEGVGGNHSFSSVFVDGEGNGVVITSMHTRERTNVFAKPLKNWGSEHELSGEEKQAIENCKNRKIL